MCTTQIKLVIVSHMLNQFRLMYRTVEVVQFIDIQICTGIDKNYCLTSQQLQHLVMQAMVIQLVAAYVN